MRRVLIPVIVANALGACQTRDEALLPTTIATTDFEQAAAAGGYRVVRFPDEDPGPPFYARLGTLLNQTFNDAEYVAIPVIRDPACIPPDFNLLDIFDPPGTGGPGAFGCQLLVHGRFLIEPDAEPGTFPSQVTSSGRPQIWFAPWPAFQDAIADGQLTLTELLALNPLRGTADTFDEMLKPRIANHHVVISSSGRLEDGRRFTFNVNHAGDATLGILIRFR